MYSVNNEWSKLTSVVLGSTYSPEFYSWVLCNKTRNMLEKMSEHACQVLEDISTFLQNKNIQVHRPQIHTHQPSTSGTYYPPPLFPRDSLCMIGKVLYYNDPYWLQYYNNIKDESWPEFKTVNDFLENASDSQIEELYNCFNLEQEMYHIQWYNKSYNNILTHVKKEGNNVVNAMWADGGLTYRIKNRLIYGTMENYNNQNKIVNDLKGYEIDCVDSKGHIDGIFSIVCPGLIIAVDDPDVDIDYEKLFPDWEIYKIQSRNLLAKTNKKAVKEFKKQHGGKWWIPGIENDPIMVSHIQKKFGHWTGNALESVFDLNMLILDEKNVLTCTYNEEIFKVLQKYGVTAHTFDVPYMYFYDGGLHCMTAELNRIDGY